MHSWQVEEKAGREAIVTRTAAGYYLQSIEGSRVNNLFIGKKPETAIKRIAAIS